jgi:hypothetical protein
MRTLSLLVGIALTVSSLIALIFAFNDRFARLNFGLLAVLGLGLIGGLVLIFLGRKALGGSTSADGTTGPTRAGRYLVDQSERVEGVDYEAVVHFTQEIKGKQAQPSSLKVSLPWYVPGQVICRPENWTDRWGKRVGLAVEPQTGDDEFDSDIYLRSDDPSFTLELFSEPSHRRAVQLLISLGFREIELGPSAAQATWVGFDPAKNDREGLTRQTAELLRPFTQATLRLPADSSLNAAQPNRTGEWILWGATGLLALLLILDFLYPPLRFWEFVWFSAGVAAVVFPALALVGYGVMRGDSRSHDRWLKWIWAALVGTALGTAGALAGINALADKTPAVTKQLPVRNLREVRGRRSSRSYYADVSDWDRPNEMREFRISVADFRTGRIGRSQIEATTSDGALGIRWIHTWRFLP